EVWQGTMARWQATDWGHDPIVVCDDGSGALSLDRSTAAAHRMLTLAAAQKMSEDYLFLEDDLLFNIHLRKNIENWPPICDRWLWMGSLYTPSLPPLGPVSAADFWPRTYFRVCHGKYWGGQGVLLSRAALMVVLSEWATPGPYDLKL